MHAKIKLFNYQEADAAWLASKRQALLASEMGLGKTAIAITAALKIKAKKIQIVCPSVAKYNWRQELLKFGDIKSEIAGEGLTHARADVVITSFEYAKKYLHLYNRTPRALLIVDEAHYLKEPTAQRTKAVLGNGGLIHNAEYFWALTGTPAPNHAGELWVLLYTFGITKMSYEGFVARYCNCVRAGGHYSRMQILGTNIKHSAELRAMLKLCAIRRLKKDELDLPLMNHNTFEIKGDIDANVLKFFPHLKDQLREEYNALIEKLGFDWGHVGDDRLLNALSLMGQSISSLRRYHGMKKVMPVAKLIKDELLAKEYSKIVLFGIHRDVLETLNSELEKDFKTILVTGKSSASQKFDAQKIFQNDPSCQIFIGNIQAAGTNLTLTEANQVGFIEQDWVPSNNAQAADRTHRIGQRLPVTARHFAIKDSLDAKITSTLTRKTKEISTFIK